MKKLSKFVQHCTILIICNLTLLNGGWYVSYYEKRLEESSVFSDIRPCNPVEVIFLQSVR
jgi:hypothetical protein